MLRIGAEPATVTDKQPHLRTPLGPTGRVTRPAADPLWPAGHPTDARLPPLGSLLHPIIAIIGLGAICAAPVTAQVGTVDPARVSSHYLPMDHWGYAYVDLLVSRGVLRLPPLMQPHRRVDIAYAVRVAGRGDWSSPESDWLEILAQEFAQELRRLDGVASDRTAVGVDLTVGAWGVTSQHRDVMRPAGEDDAFVIAETDWHGNFPSLATALRFRWDDQFLNDPQFPDGKVVEEHPNFLGFLDFGARSEDAYAEVQLPQVRILAGRLYRNWGLPGTQGLLISDYAYSYDQIGYRFGGDRLSITGFVAQLDEFEGSVKRWMSAHRLDWRVSDALSLAFGETVIYGGENRGLDFRLSMPIAVWLVGGFGQDFREGPNSNNSFSQLSAWWKPGAGATLYGTIMFDHFIGDETPPGYGIAAGVHFPRVTSRLGIRVDYSQIASTVYRSPRDAEIYTFRNIGLGRDLADYDLTSVQLQWMPFATLFLHPTLRVQRLGEGSFFDPYPLRQPELPWLFIGQKETTWRLAVTGQWRPNPHAWLDWDVGQNIIKDRGHVAGLNETEFVARVRANVTWGAAGVF